MRRIFAVIARYCRIHFGFLICIGVIFLYPGGRDLCDKLDDDMQLTDGLWRCRRRLRPCGHHGRQFGMSKIDREAIVISISRNPTWLSSGGF